MLLLWLNRGTVFFFDEMVWFADLSTYTDPSSVLVPHNSHLHGTTRVVYYLVMEVFGADYFVIRLLGAFTVVICAGLFLELARRRVGAAPALVVAIILLFYGSAWQHVVGPIGFTVLISIAAGLVALLALERNDRRGDVIACAAVCMSVFSFTVGLGYLVGVAISVLLRRDRIKRAWIFAIPLLLYGVWWLWAAQFDQGRTELSNISKIGSFFVDSLAVTTGGLTGVNIPFSRFGETAGVSEAPASTLGYVVAALFVLALAWRISRGNLPPSLWVSLGVVSTYWLAGALADPIFFGTQADAVRYVYPGSIGVLLVATDVARGLRIGRNLAFALLAVAAFSLAMNLVFLRDGGAYLRSYSAITKGNLAMLELGAASVASVATDEIPAPDESPIPGYLGYGPDPEDYLASVAQYGSPAFTIAEVREQLPAVRATSDEALVDTYNLAPVPTAVRPGTEGCRRSDGASPIELPPGGAYLRPLGAAQVPIAVSRFSDGPGIEIGSLQARQWSALLVPTDPAPDPWRLWTPAGRQVLVCPVA